MKTSEDERSLPENAKRHPHTSDAKSADSPLLDPEFEQIQLQFHVKLHFKGQLKRKEEKLVSCDLQRTLTGEMLPDSLEDERASSHHKRLRS